jgi:hypothetical protein
LQRIIAEKRTIKLSTQRKECAVPEDDYEEMKTLLPSLARAMGKRPRSHKVAANLPGSMLISDIPCYAVHQDKAVQRCCALRNSLILDSPTPEVRLQWDKEFLDLYETFEQVFGQDPKPFEIAKVSAMAYRAAMPDPIHRRAIKSFIACVLHAMSIGILDSDHGARLLNGARAATAALGPKRQREKKKDRQADENGEDATETSSKEEEEDLVHTSGV